LLVSIVVPAFNEEQYIRRCLEALARQYHPHFEIETIVVDGSSTDRTREIAHEYGVRLVVQQHRGIAQARQMGFEAARGEIIASTDAESAPPRDWLMRLVAGLHSTPDVVGSATLYRYPVKDPKLRSMCREHASDS
jgi:glycosyltransferase involved in cell wall biosynthesis